MKNPLQISLGNRGKRAYDTTRDVKLVRSLLFRLNMKQQIMVVDDEAQIRELLALYLNKKGYSVATAGNSTEALKLAGQTHIDLVVLDISLAGEDGLSVLTAIKARHPATKVVMLTGMGFVEDLLQEAQEKGADGYVSKVLPLDELLLAIHRTLRPSDLAEAA